MSKNAPTDEQSVSVDSPKTPLSAGEMELTVPSSESHDDTLLDEALEQTFPASDPISHSGVSRHDLRPSGSRPDRGEARADQASAAGLKEGSGRTRPPPARLR